MGRRWAAAGIVAEVAAFVALTLVWFPSVWAVLVAVVDIDQSAGPDIGVVLSEVANNPEPMWGRTVTISAAVDDILGPRAMIIGNDAFLVGDTVLVLGAPDLASLLVPPTTDRIDDAAVVRVTGEVRPFDPAALATDLGIDPDAVARRYGGKSVLVAREIEPDPPTHAGPGDKEFAAGSSGYDIGITINDLVDRPDDYLGEVVQVSDEIDEPALTPHAFVLGDEQLLVIDARASANVFIEATAYVTGRVERFDLAELEAALGIDLDDARLARFAGEPVIVADAVEVVT